MKIFTLFPMRFNAIFAASVPNCSNGGEIVLRLAMKPIPTLMKGLKSVDYRTKKECVAESERSDVCAIFALEVIAEAAVAKVLACVVKERVGGDTIEQAKERYDKLP